VMDILSSVDQLHVCVGRRARSGRDASDRPRCINDKRLLRNDHCLTFYLLSDNLLD